jgi:hypothetical protein
MLVAVVLVLVLVQLVVDTAVVVRALRPVTPLQRTEHK